MKQIAKSLSNKIGINHSINLARAMPGIIKWLKEGCIGNAPLPLKRLILLSYMRRYKLTHLIETGTHLGETVDYFARISGFSVTSIELDDSLYQQAKERFSGKRNVTLIHGDSGEVLPRICGSLKERALFWLDGHYSGTGTAKGEIETPILAELRAITTLSYEHVVLIDDARCFGSDPDYPLLEDFIAAARSTKRFKNIEVTADIIRLTP
jgi:hypothetical protein